MQRPLERDAAPRAEQLRLKWQRIQELARQRGQRGGARRRGARQGGVLAGPQAAAAEGLEVLDELRNLRWGGDGVAGGVGGVVGLRLGGRGRRLRSGGRGEAAHAAPPCCGKRRLPVCGRPTARNGAATRPSWQVANNGRTRATSAGRPSACRSSMWRALRLYSVLISRAWQGRQGAARRGMWGTGVRQAPAGRAGVGGASSV